VLVAIVWLVVAACIRTADAHPTLSSIALVKVAPDGTVQVRLIHDALAYALNDTSARISDPEMYALLAGPENELAAALQDGKERLQSGMQLMVDGKPLSLEIVEAPTVEAVRRWKIENPSRQLPMKMEFVARATLPRGAAEMTLKFPAVLADVLISVDRPGLEPSTLPLSPGETSPAIDVRMATGAASSGSAASEAPKNPATVMEVAWRYTKLGYRHIMPEGTDHMLFVLGLFLLSPRIKSVLWQITAFTIAHSITLTLATLHLVTISSRIVEPTIALTIAFIGIENLVVKKVHPWRPVVAFIFGLVHGLGFASGLMEIGLPTGQLATGLIAFNVGVEGGHLTVLLAAYLVLGWWRDKPWYRKRISIPLSLLIAGVALFWMVQRVIMPE
jgi:hydrogenase/urease accessory protein HupE